MIILFINDIITDFLQIQKNEREKKYRIIYFHSNYSFHYFFSFQIQIIFRNIFNIFPFLCLIYAISISQINQIFRTNCIFKPSKMLISSVQTFTQLPTHRLIKVRQSENRGCRSTLRIDVR